MLAGLFGDYMIITGIIVAFIMTIVLLMALKNKLPQDHGRAFAVDGNLSKGKARGCGIILVLVLFVCNLLFNIITLENNIYMVIVVLTMLSGYFDDASDKPWNEYLKGFLDLLLAIGVAVNYLYFNGNTFCIMILRNMQITLPYWLCGLLIVILVWVAINVTNCTDGVDGLCGTLSIITIGSFYVLGRNLGDMNDTLMTAILFVVVLIAYLWFNSTPSTMLMGDAGSRAIGIFIAILAIKSGAPLLYIPFSLVMILDGGLGLLKVALLRFLKIRILANTRCPLHDQARKVNNWSNTQVCYRFTIIQVMISAVIICIINKL